MGGNFVQRRCHQGIRGKLDPGSDLAFHAGHDHVEIVKGTECDLAYASAFGRLRIDVIQVRKVGRIFHIAEKR